MARISSHEPRSLTMLPIQSSRKSRIRRAWSMRAARHLTILSEYLSQLVLCQDRNGMDQPAIGRQLRARRTAAGRTVASVAEAAGLSVPYIANLENGRGNPTI